MSVPQPVPPGAERPLRVACVIAGMQAGGAERVMGQLCNHLARTGHAVTLVTLTSAAKKPFYPVSDAVQQRPIGKLAEGTGLARVARVLGWIVGLRRTLSAIKPHVVISFVDLTNVMTLLATTGLKLPVIVSERIDPTAYAHRLSRLDHSLRRLTYPRADWIVVQTHRAAKFFDLTLGSRIVTIPNPVPASDLAAQPDRPSADGRFRVICVGRLDHQKGFDILIESFFNLANEFQHWDVVIFGEGPERPNLQAGIRAHGLEGRIRLMGVSRDVAREMANSHIAGFPSRYEGFPNALAEAMAVGLPAIAFNGVSGVEDLVVSGESGLLVDWDQRATKNPARSFAAGLRQLMMSAELRTRLGAGGKIRVQQYEPAIVLKQWQDLVARAGIVKNT